MDAIAVPAARLGADHRAALRDQLRDERQAGADVDRGLRAREGEEAQDARLVGSQRFEDPHVGGVEVAGLQLGRLSQQLGAAAAQRPHRGVGDRAPPTAARSRRGAREPEHAAGVLAQLAAHVLQELRRRLAAGRGVGPAATRRGRRPAPPSRRSATRPRRRSAPSPAPPGPDPQAAEDRRPRANAGRLAHRRCRFRRSSEDRQVYQAGAEAEHGAVQVEQPLVLAHRRAQHLGEVGGAHLAHPRRDELADAAALRPG